MLFSQSRDFVADRVAFGNLERTLSKNLDSPVIRWQPESLAEPTGNLAQVA